MVIFYFFCSLIGETDLLMVDGLVQQMGSSVTELWDREGGSGLYPPPSLHVSDYYYVSLVMVEITCKCWTVVVIFIKKPLILKLLTG